MAVHLNFHGESSNLPNNLHAMIPFQTAKMSISHEKDTTINKTARTRAPCNNPRVNKPKQALQLDPIPHLLQVSMW